VYNKDTMINLVTITGVKYTVDEATKKYVARKISRLDRYMPRHARQSASAEVLLKEVNRAHGNKYEAEVIIKLPGKTIVAKDSTVNILAAVDIAEAKLVTQLEKYRAVLKRRKTSRKVLARLRGGTATSNDKS